MAADALRDELRGANANRAILYYLIFDVMRKVLDEEETIAVMKYAIYFECETWTAGKRGCCTLKAYAPA